MSDTFQPIYNPNTYLPKRLWVAPSLTCASVLQIDDYTVAAVFMPSGAAYGIAKRNRTDKPNPEIGIRIALARAVKKLRGNNGRT